MNTTGTEALLTAKEIKMLRKEYLNQIFPSLSVTLFLFLIILVYSSLQNHFGTLFFTLTIVSFIIGFFVFRKLSGKYRNDLKGGHAKLFSEMITDKVYKLEYEPGSRTFPVNLLSIIFIKKIAQLEMREMHIYYIIVNGERIDIDKADFERIHKGEVAVLRRAPHSNLFLGIQ